MKPRLIRISPSILCIDYNDDIVLKLALDKIEQCGANMVHLDVMDGKFVSNKTFDHKLVDKIKDLTSLMLDVHLMVENPHNKIADYAKAGADIITVHYEACENIEETLKLIKSKNVLAGVAINPKTPAMKLKDLLNRGLVDMVTVMGVNPGASGQPIIPGSAEKVAEIRDMDKKVYIQIDGGVTLKNVSILRRMGANVIVSSKAIFSAKNMKKAIKILKGHGFMNKKYDDV